MTFNIRCGYCEDINNINHWSKRKTLVAQVIRNENPDLIGLQEAEQFQIHDLEELLVDYNWVGVGRDDGQTLGEATAIFYRKGRLNLQSQKTLWISETPEKVSKGWDAALNRTVTILKLRDTFFQKDFQIFNTHLDHLGLVARYKGSEFLKNLIGSVPANLPVILTGDFNFNRNFDAYNLLIENLDDTQFVPFSNSYGGDQTFNGFGTDKNEHNKIDYIFVNKSWVTLSHNIILQKFDGRFPSDHYPIIVSLDYK